MPGHCSGARGFRGCSPGVLVYSRSGCVLYGASVIKRPLPTRRDRPRWIVPVVGGVLFAAVIGLWLTSSLWVFTTTGLHL